MKLFRFILAFSLLSSGQLLSQTEDVGWTQRNPAQRPSQRGGHAMVYDSARKEIVLFGGMSGSGLNDTWIWDGNNWVERLPSRRPPARSGHGMAYDRARSQAVLFGGFSSVGGHLNDTWLWDGTNWTQIGTGQNETPHVRSSHAMAYDILHAEVVLFGGTYSDPLTRSLGDTWTWNGYSWSLRTPTQNPGPRLAAAASYDWDRGEVILFGGASLVRAIEGDTWAWNGSNWSKKQPLQNASASSSASMTQVPGGTLMFGGYHDDGALLKKTWLWDGLNWTDETPEDSSGSPKERVSHSLAYDEVNQQVVLFGGESGFQTTSGTTWDSLGDTWVWSERKINTPGIISTIVGSGPTGNQNGAYSGDGQPAVQARLWSPHDVAVDWQGNLYVSDLGNNAIRKVTPNGVISTVARASRPFGLAVDKKGNIYFADHDAAQVRKISPDGTTTVVAGSGIIGGYSGDQRPALTASLVAIEDVAVDRWGNVFFTQGFANRVCKVDPRGTLTTVAGTGIPGFSGDNGPATNAQLNFPYSLATDRHGNLFIVDQFNYRIRKVSPTGTITTVAGNGITGGLSADGVPAASVWINPLAVYVDPSDTVYYADYSTIRKFRVGGNITTLGGNRLSGFSGDGGLAIQAQLGQIGGIFVDVLGNILVADSTNNRIRKVNGAGMSDILPTGLRAEVRDKAIDLRWDPPLVSVDAVIVTVEVSSAGGPFTKLTELDSRTNPGVFLAAAEFSAKFDVSHAVENDLPYRFTIQYDKSGIKSKPSDPIVAVPGRLSFDAVPRPNYPILLLHGFHGSADTFRKTRNFMANALGWRDGGTMSIGTTKIDVSGGTSEGKLDPGADFFSVNFGDPHADYPDGAGIERQGEELRNFIQKMRDDGISNRIAVVAHSNGGLAARAFLTNFRSLQNELAQLITIGTPHRGADIQSLKKSIVWDVALGTFFLVKDFGVAWLLGASADAIITYLENTQGGKDASYSCNGTSIELSPFLKSINTALPEGIDYKVIIGINSLLSKDADCQSAEWDGLVPESSADLGQLPIVAGTGTTIKKLYSDRFHASTLELFGIDALGIDGLGFDFSAISCALSPTCVQYEWHSPVEVELIAPDGRRISKDTSAIAAATYSLREDRPGHQTGTITVPFPLPGIYQIRVTRKPDALPTDTYTLTVTRDGVTRTLASSRQVQNIPPAPYVDTVASPLKIDIKPREFPNSINLRSSGTTPVAIMATTGFDPRSADMKTIFFGRRGSEVKALSASFEDINRDGRPDLVLHFPTSQLGLLCSDNLAILRGKTSSGGSFYGSDSIKPTGCK